MKIKHLEMIERIIERMEKNSFAIKEWTIVLTTAISALAVYDADKRFIIVTFIPIVMFWLLDSYYLFIERRYRILYTNVAESEESNTDFNLDASKISNLNENQTKKACYFQCMFSMTEIVFYLPITMSVIILSIVLQYCNS